MSEVGRELVDLPVVVLAAGCGHRMGGPKALMTVRGRAWWRWQDERLRSYGLEACWVVSPRVQEAMRESGTVARHMVVADETAPMFASVLTGLAAVNSLDRGAFVLPVDTPVPRVEHWQRLAGSDAPAHPTCRGRGGHPLFLPCGWIERELGPLLAATGESGAAAAGIGIRLDTLIEGSCHRVEVDDPAVVVNLNEPADVEAWLKDGDQN